MLRRVAIFVLLWLVGSAHAISYTVQVAAVSDQDSALTLVRQLLRDGYPAYFVRTSTEDGFVFRIRVGAFENRSAAVVYADAMPTIAGARAIPALAEAIPVGIMPLAPLLLLTADLAGMAAEIHPWNGGIAFRTQPLDPLREATYYVIDEVSPVTFDAWSATVLADGRVARVRNLRLWPEGEVEESEAVRAEFAAQVRRLIAEQLGVASDVVDEVVFTTADDVPALIVVETFRPGTPDSAQLIGLADPRKEFNRHGPSEFVVGGDVLNDIGEPIVAFIPGSADGAGGNAPDAQTVEGEAWSAVRDGDFARLQTAGSSWRAVVGAPVWAADDLLVTRDGDRLLFYRFLERPLEGANGG